MAGTYLDLIGFAPIVALIITSLALNCTLKPTCKWYLNDKLQILAAELTNA